jgi:hypothetical protein
LQQAIKTVAAGENQAVEAPWEKAIRERHQKVRRAWNTLAAAFEVAGQAALAQEIKQFLSAMPSSQTEREYFIELAKKLLAKQMQVKDRGRSR